MFEFFHRAGTERGAADDEEPAAERQPSPTPRRPTAVTEAEIDAALAEDADRAG